MVDLGSVFCPFGGLMGAPGVMAGGDGLLGGGLGLSILEQNPSKFRNSK